MQHEAVTGVRRVPADLLADPAQAVSHGVGVHEQVPGGGLQAAAQGQVGGHRALEGVAHLVQGGVHQVEDLLAGELIAGQKALRKEVVGVDRVGSLGPAGQGS